MKSSHAPPSPAGASGVASRVDASVSLGAGDDEHAARERAASSAAAARVRLWGIGTSPSGGGVARGDVTAEPMERRRRAPSNDSRQRGDLGAARRCSRERMIDARRGCTVRSMRQWFGDRPWHQLVPLPGLVLQALVLLGSRRVWTDVIPMTSRSGVTSHVIAARMYLLAMALSAGGVLGRTIADAGFVGGRGMRPPDRGGGRLRRRSDPRGRRDHAGRVRRAARLAIRPLVVATVASIESARIQSRVVNDLTGPPPPQRVSWIELIGGWLVVALCLGLGASISCARCGRVRSRS